MTVRRASVLHPVSTWRLVRDGRDAQTRVLPGQPVIVVVVVLVLFVFAAGWLVVAATQGFAESVLPAFALLISLFCLRPRIVLTRKSMCVVNFFSVWSVDWAALDGSAMVMVPQRGFLKFELADGTALRAWMYEGGTYGFSRPGRGFGARMRAKLIEYARTQGAAIEVRLNDEV